MEHGENKQLIAELLMCYFKEFEQYWNLGWFRNCIELPNSGSLWMVSSIGLCKLLYAYFWMQFNSWYTSTCLLGCFVLYKDCQESARFGRELHGTGCIIVEGKTPWGSYICNSALHRTMQSKQRCSRVPEKGKGIYFYMEAYIKKLTFSHDD